MASSGWQGNKEFPYSNTYIKCNLRIDSVTHSGDTLRVTGAVGAVCPYSSSSYWGSYAYPVYVTPDHSTERKLLSGGERVYGGGNSGLDSAVTSYFDTSFTIAANRTSCLFDVDVDMNNGSSSGRLSWQITFDQGYTAPNTPTVSAIIPAADPTGSVQITWGTSSFGNPSSGTVYLYGGKSASPTSQLLTKTTTGNSVFTHNEPLTPNTKYYYRARACNSQLCSGYSSDATAITNPIPPILTIDSVSYNSASFTISAPSQGSARALTAIYMIDNDPASSTSVVSLPATISLPFNPGTTHTISVYFSTPASINSTVSSATFTTNAPFYGSVNGESKAVSKLYGSVNGEATLVEHLYGPEPINVLVAVSGVVTPGGAGNVTAFDGDIFFNTIAQDPDLEEAIIHSGKTITSIDYFIEDGWFWDSIVYFSDESAIAVGGTNYPINDPADLGFTISYVQDGGDVVSLTGTYETQYFSKLIF